MKLIDIIKEYTITKPDPNRPPSLLEVIKDRYYCFGEGLREGNYYTKEEIYSTLYHSFAVGDVWELQKGKSEEIEGEYYYKCIKGTHKSEYSDEMGWVYNDSNKDFFKILKR